MRKHTQDLRSHVSYFCHIIPSVSYMLSLFWLNSLSIGLTFFSSQLVWIFLFIFFTIISDSTVTANATRGVLGKDQVTIICVKAPISNGGVMDVTSSIWLQVNSTHFQWVAACVRARVPVLLFLISHRAPPIKWSAVTAKWGYALIIFLPHIYQV